MSGGVLAGGRRRRRSGWGGPVAAVVALALVAGVAFAFLSSGGAADGPLGGVPVARGGLGALGGLSPLGAVRHAPAPVPRPRYARFFAPPRERVHTHFKHPPRSAILFNVRTGELMWAHRPGRALPIASLTKMMTAILVNDRGAPGAAVRITRQALHYSGSGVGELPKHKRVRLETLLYGLLLPSGNDAAIALAQHVSGTQRRFVALMNRTVRRMGLGCTHYASPSGIVDRRNYSCTSDLAYLAHQMLGRPRLARIVRTRSVALPFPIKGGKLFLYNNNPLLYERYPGTDGVKTGYTEKAGPCLVATVRRGRAWLGVVLLRSPNPPGQARKLFGAGFRALGRER
jgi:serine-type D-Ala-D-Ala carboxypeptidase (penicillin-binding protein 5/6)